MTCLAIQIYPACKLELYQLNRPTTKAILGQVPYVKYINLSTKHWYKVRSTMVLSPSGLYIRLSLERQLGGKNSSLGTLKCLVYRFSNQFLMFLWQSLVISHPIIMFASLKSFMFNSSHSYFFIYCIALSWLAASIRLSI